MSENKNDRKLPGKDYFRNYSPTGKNKRGHTKLSEEEKKGFEDAFGDSEDEVKAYVPSSQKNEEEVKHQKAQQNADSGEDMYALPEFNTDEFFQTLGFGIEKNEDKIPDEPQIMEETRVIEQEDVKIHEIKPEEKKEITHTDTLSGTKHFSIRSMTRKMQLDKNKKSFMQNFRVLSKNREDRAIIEAAPAGNGGKNLADFVKTRKGEDIFEAVEKAYLEKDEVTEIKIESSAVRKERNLKGAKRGEEIRKECEVQLEKQKKKLLAYAVLFVLCLITTAFFSSFKFYALFSLIVSAVLFVMNISAFRRSFNAIKKLSAVPETALAVMSFFVLIHNITVYALGIGGYVYTICLVLACTMRSASRYFNLRNRVRLINMATSSKSLSMLQKIPFRSETADIAPGDESKSEPDIYYCAKAFLDSAVEEPAYDPTSENKHYVFSMSLVLLSSLVVGLLCFVKHFTGISFISALTATVCALLPVMYDPLSRYIFFSKGQPLLKHGACISGREALQHIDESDGFVLDARDVFSADVSRFRKSAASDIAQSDSAVFTAILLNEAGSVLAPCFDDFMSQMNITLPAVEDFQYEEKLGYSAWILDRKILVGNRQMLVNHSITVPSKEHEKAYGKNRFVMYVVVDGVISATFLVSYKVLSSLKQYSRDFNKTGLVLMLSSREAFLNEEVVSAKLSLDISSVKVLSAKATEVMNKFNSSIDEQTPAGLLCSMKKKSIMHLIMGCYNLNSADKLIRSMMSLGQILCLALLIVSPILNMPFFLNPIVIVALRAVWCFATGFFIERKK